MNHKCRLIAIAGGSGAGKTWLAARLQLLTGKETGRLSLDDFYRDRSHLSPRQRERVNVDHPRAIDWTHFRAVLEGCARGERVQTPRYDFRTHTRRTEGVWWVPRALVLVEGLWLLRSPAIRRLFDLTLFLDCPEIIRFDRRVQRDLAERGRTRESVERMFQARVSPMHERYVAPQRHWADLVLSSPVSELEVQGVAERLELLMQPR